MAAGPDRLYVANGSFDDSGGRLFGLSASGGVPEWETSGLSGWTQPPVVAGETVLVDTGESLRAFATSDGSEQWSRSADPIEDRFVVVDDLVVPTDGRTVRALRPP